MNLTDWLVLGLCLLHLLMQWTDRALGIPKGREVIPNLSNRDEEE